MAATPWKGKAALEVLSPNSHIWSTSSRTNPPSTISRTSTMRCSVGMLKKTKKNFSTLPTTRTTTRTQKGEVDFGEVCGWVTRVSCVPERNQSYLPWSGSRSFPKFWFGRYAWIWVWKWGPNKFLRILWMLSASKVRKNKLYSTINCTQQAFVRATDAF